MQAKTIHIDRIIPVVNHQRLHHKYLSDNLFKWQIPHYKVMHIEIHMHKDTSKTCIQMHIDINLDNK